MNRTDIGLPHDLALLMRAFAALGYVGAFGHSSLRSDTGAWITPTSPPPAGHTRHHMLHVDQNGDVLSGNPASRPIEVFLHVAVYAARPDVLAICRTHAPMASSMTCESELPPIVHGFGGLVRTLARYDDCDLVHSVQKGQAAARALGDAEALLLRGNGVLTVGASLSQAAARMWALEERCRYASVCRTARSFEAAEYQARSVWYPAEQERIWTWLRALGAADWWGAE